MNKLLIFLFCFPLFLFTQSTFLKKNIDTKWINGTNELSFLETIDNNNNSYKAVSSNEFIFFIELDNNEYSPKDLESERILNCCMCSYTAITQNSNDTLKIEKGSRDDFGNSEIIINTFYIKDDNLIQVKKTDNNPPLVTNWLRLSNLE